MKPKFWIVSLSILDKSLDVVFKPEVMSFNVSPDPTVYALLPHPFTSFLQRSRQHSQKENLRRTKTRICLSMLFHCLKTSAVVQRSVARTETVSSMTVMYHPSPQLLGLWRHSQRGASFILRKVLQTETTFVHIMVSENSIILNMHKRMHKRMNSE